MKMNEFNKIEFKDLSLGLKIPIVIIWIFIVLFILGFFTGFIQSIFFLN